MVQLECLRKGPGGAGEEDGGHRRVRERQAVLRMDWLLSQADTDRRGPVPLAQNHTLTAQKHR